MAFDPQFRKPALLQPHHGLEAFDCGQLSLDTFLKTVALHNQMQGYSRTYVVADREFAVVGYHSLCAGMISREQSPRQVKGHGAPREIPVALLARLAVTRSMQGKGLGSELLRHALLSVLSTSETIAFRAVMVHALDDEAARFYGRYGFRPAKGLERTLLLPVKDIVAALS